MKLISKTIIVLLTFFYFLEPPHILAQQRFFERKPQLQTLPVNQKTTSDYFAVGNTVALSGTVQGDAFIAGGNVVIDGTIAGDLLVAGGNVTFSGDIRQNVRMLAGSATINGRVGKNITVVSGNVSIGHDARIDGNLVGLSGNTVINGQISGDIRIKAGKFELGDNARVDGDIFYESPKQGEISQNAYIGGKISYLPGKDGITRFSSGKFWYSPVSFIWSGFSRGISFLGLAVSFTFGFIILRLFPRRMVRKCEIVRTRFWDSLGLGILAIILSPFIFLILAVTIVGLPIAFLLVLLLIFFAYLAKIWVGFYVGRVILSRLGQGDRRGWALILGLLIYYLIDGLPHVGWMIKLVVIFLGVGVFLLEKKELYHALTHKKIA